MALADEKRSRYGIRKANPTPASITIAATPTNIYLISPGRSFNVRKILITNRQAAPVTVQFGTGLGGAFVQSIPGIYAVNGQDLELIEDQIPGVDFMANLTAQSSAAAVAPNDIQITVEVEEYPGVTG